MPAPSYKFGEFDLDCGRFELRRNGRPVKLERIPLDLLILLAEKDGNVVTRPEIVDRLWGQDVFVDTEHGINTAIRKIRAALREDAENPVFLLTVQGKGYRVAAEKFTVATPTPAPEKPEAPISSPKPESESRTPDAQRPTAAARRRYAIAAVALCVVATATLALIPTLRHRILGLTNSTHIHSIAVLPLANLSGDPAQDYFSDGMTDELITMLAKNTSLRVISRTSVMQYKGVQKPVREIAQALGVDGILEGSITRSATHVDMTVQLIHAPSDTHIWAESYDRDLNAAFSLPSELSQTIARQIKSATSALTPQRYVDPQAHDAFLHGRSFWFQGNMDLSRQYMEKALALQPDYAAAWAGLADTYTVRAVAGEAPTQEVIVKAEAAANQAVELDESFADAHKARGGVLLFLKWDWKGAETELLRAIELDPNASEIHHLYSYVLTATNRMDQALQEQKQATELDSFARPWALGNAYMYDHQFDAAINEFRVRSAIQPRVAYLHEHLARAYWIKGLKKEAVEEWKESRILSGDSKSAEEIQRAFNSSGPDAVPERELAELKIEARSRYVSPLSLAYAAAALQHKEEALKYLEAAARELAPALVFLQHEPVFDFLHGEQRYRAVVKKIGLPPAY